VFVEQKAATAYIDRKKYKFPKRMAERPGLRPRSHFTSKERNKFDSFAKQHYWDLFRDVEGNDRPNFKGILEGTDIPAADMFFEQVYALYLAEKQNQDLQGAAGGAPNNVNAAFDSDDDVELDN
jgi:hypothetical protein